MQQKLSLIFGSILMFLSIFSHGQEASPKPIDGTIYDFGIGLGYNIPGGDLSTRYGNNLNFSIGVDYISAKNWVINPEFIYFFGTNVKEDVLAPFRTSNGAILGDDAQVAGVILKERGMYLGLGLGRLFPLGTSTRSGVKITLGGGLLQHGLKFSDERNSIAQIRAGRSIGYDRLTRGFSTKETIAYKYLGKDRRLNFEIGLDFVQGYTSEVRAINFDTGLPTIKSRLDLMFGFRFVWNIPYYTGSEATVYY